MADAAGWFADPSGKVNTFRRWDGRAWTRWLSADPSAPEPGPVLTGPSTSGADRPLTGPAVAPPEPTETPLAVVYDQVTRRLSVQELQATMPDKPFSCDLEPRTVPGAFTSAFECTAWVHFDFNAKHDDWVATTGLGDLEEQLRTGRDLDAIADATFSALAAQSYDLDDVTVKKKQTERLTGVAPDGKAVLVSAEMHVSNKDLPTKYDRMLVAVFELESGRHAAYFAIRPNDSKTDVVEAMHISAATVTARK